MTVFHRGGDLVGVATGGSGTAGSASLDGVGDVLRIANEENVSAYVKVGAGAQTASASADVIVLAHTVVFQRISFEDDTVSVAGQGAAAQVKVMRGSAG